MLRYSAHYAVPMLFYFFTFSVIHFRQDACILRYSARHAVPMLFYFFTFSVVHFRQDVCILRYSAHYALRSLALNLSLPPLAVPSPTEVPQPPLPPSHPAQRRWLIQLPSYHKESQPFLPAVQRSADGSSNSRHTTPLATLPTRFNTSHGQCTASEGLLSRLTLQEGS